MDPKALARSRKWQKAHPGYYKKRYAAARVRLDAMKMAVGCIDCGYNKHPAALDYDHIGPKLRNVAQMLLGNWERLLREVDKCVVRCANCHRIKTAQRNKERRE